MDALDRESKAISCIHAARHIGTHNLCTLMRERERKVYYGHKLIEVVCLIKLQSPSIAQHVTYPQQC